MHIQLNTQIVYSDLWYTFYLFITFEFSYIIQMEINKTVGKKMFVNGITV